MAAQENEPGTGADDTGSAGDASAEASPAEQSPAPATSSAPGAEDVHGAAADGAATPEVAPVTGETGEEAGDGAELETQQLPAPAEPPVQESAASAGSAVSAPSAASAGSPAEPTEGAEPTVQLEALGLRGSRGWAFRDVDLVAGPGELVAITGSFGSGRSALLLAIAGRLRPTTGSLQVAGSSLGSGRSSHRELRRVRAHVAVARLADHIGLDPDLTVEVNARDAADWARCPRAEVQDRLEEWRERTGLVLEPRTPVAELSALEATALHLLLAAVIDPEVIVLDDADADLTGEERAQLWHVAAQVAASGPTVIATATDPPAEADVQLVLYRHTSPGSHAATTPPDHTQQDHDPEQEDTSPTDQSEGPEEHPEESDPEGHPEEPDPEEHPDQPGTDRDGAER